MNPLSLAAAVAHPPEPVSPKVLRAAQDFEAVLLNSFLQAMQQAFSALPGADSKSAGSEDYSYMGTQALASQLARGGGIGDRAPDCRPVAAHEGIG